MSGRLLGLDVFCSRSDRQTAPGEQRPDGQRPHEPGDHDRVDRPHRPEGEADSRHPEDPAAVQDHRDGEADPTHHRDGQFDQEWLIVRMRPPWPGTT